MNRFKYDNWGYAVAILATCVVLLARWLLLDQILGREFPLVLFVISVVAAAWVGGLKPGLLAVALGLAGGIYFYTERQGLWIPQPYDRVRIVFFILVGGLVSADIESLRIVQHRLDAREKQIEVQEELLAIEVKNRRKFELALREREERFCMAVESADIGTWDLNVLTGERQWSDRAKAMFGLALYEDVSKISFLELVHPEDREKVDQAIRAALDSRGTGRYRIEYRILRPDGKTRWVVAKGQAFFQGEASDRRALRFIGTVLDITDRKEMEESLKKADRRKDEFLAVLAHELRNPVVPLRNALQIWATVKSEPAELERLRSMMNRQVQQMIRLIDDLLDVARITQGKFELQKRRLDLVAVVSNAVEALRPVVQDTGHSLHVSLPSATIMIDGDEARLTQIFNNILHNAIRCTARHGVIEINIETRGDEALVTVRDNGVGIPEGMLSDIFEPFQQVHSSANGSHAGLGIGLNLAKQIAEIHGGGIEARSEGTGHGSEFVVTLPLFRSEGATTDTREIERRPLRVPCRKIVIVDDVQDSANTLATILRSRGQVVSVAFDGLSAIQTVLSDRPQVVFVDLGMPEMDGYEVARRLRVRPELGDLVLVALTGYGDTDAHRRSREAGFDHHVIKTADIEDLEQILLRLPGELAN